MEILIKIDQQGNLTTSPAHLAAPPSEEQTVPTAPSGGVGATGAIDAGPAPVAPPGIPGPAGGLPLPLAGARTSAGIGGYDAGAGPVGALAAGSAGALGASPLGHPPPQVGSTTHLMRQFAQGGPLSAGPAPGYDREPATVVVEAEE